MTDIGSGAAPLSGDVIEEAEGLWPKGGPKLKVFICNWGIIEIDAEIRIARMGNDRSNVLASGMGPNITMHS